jgi:hypothetical protein
MLDVSNLGKVDLSAIDTREITSDEWEAVKREAIRRAHAERARVVRDLAKRLWCGWQAASSEAVSWSRRVRAIERPQRFRNRVSNQQ